MKGYECTHSCVLVLVLLEVKQCYIQIVCGVLSAISYFRFSVSNQIFCIQVFTSNLLKSFVQVAEALTSILSML
jgi:hypothetical protein